jgi:hypothetical protein
MYNNHYIHPSYKTHEILKFVESFIHDYSCQCFEDISLSDKYKLAAMLSHQDGVIDGFAFLTEHDDRDRILELFRRCTVSPKASHNDDFIEMMKDAFIDHYSPTMEKLFNYVLEDHKADIEANIDHTRKYGDEDAAYDTYVSNNL